MKVLIPRVSPGNRLIKTYNEGQTVRFSDGLMSGGPQSSVMTTLLCPRGSQLGVGTTQCFSVYKTIKPTLFDVLINRILYCCVLLNVDIHCDNKWDNYKMSSSFCNANNNFSQSKPGSEQLSRSLCWLLLLQAGTLSRPDLMSQ